MSIHISSEEIEQLSRNPSVFKCSDRSIIYTFEFKKSALEQYNQGVGCSEIWRRAGFDITKWNKHYTKDCIHNWKRIFKRKGFDGLAKVRGTQATGRPKTKGLTDADKIRRLELQVRYLEAENDFLAKLRAKRAESNSGQIKNSKSSGN
jgi:transposase-like protein